ncbi:carboxylesterase family protein [Xylariaceae sp. FL0594]|nr:carboxylesterase family protein [Xylariaceae sp. FL0594]
MLSIIRTLPFLALASLCLASPSAPSVDLGYAKYQGFYDSARDQNVFNGIRYAAPPVGHLRWRMPQPPAVNRTAVFPATDYAPQCPQSGSAPGTPKPQPTGDEDCLFLNVIAPAKAKNLPVLVWIHGGGYGQGNNRFDLGDQIHTNGNSYITVSIAYRLGAFGWLSSAETARSGIVNAGLHDMRFALQWVKRNIRQFGGNPNEVTISGESAGGGSVMLLALANGGTEGNALFKGLIASSPYIPTQWNFDDSWPTLSYQAFVDSAGCSAARSKLECLRSADTVVLQNASETASRRANFGQWAFLPVTDGKLVRKRPSRQLVVEKRVNGNRMLTGSNENEGSNFTPQNVTTEAAFVNFVLTNYPRLSEQNISSVLELYSVPDSVSDVYADSDGLTAPFSTTNSNWAVGWQQAANNLYAETTFVCPSYWMADAYGGVRGRSSWKYQFSVPISDHGSDIAPIYQSVEVQGTGIDKVFRTAFQQTWGNFIVRGDPSLSAAQVDTAQAGNITAASYGTWRQWGGRPEADYMLNLNMTGGMPVTTVRNVGGKSISLTSYTASTSDAHPPLKAKFNLASGWSWEGGRGKRCQLWADLGPWALL